MTFLLPDVDRAGRNLADATKEALELGIRACGPGRRLNGIGKAIEWVDEPHALLLSICPTRLHNIHDRNLIWLLRALLTGRVEISQSVIVSRSTRNSQDTGLGATSTKLRKYIISVSSPISLAISVAAESELTTGIDNSDRATMSPGDCFTIEPSLVQGSNSRGFLWDDGWTMSTEVSWEMTPLASSHAQLIQ